MSSAAASVASAATANGPKAASSAAATGGCPAWASDVLHFWFDKFGPVEWFRGGEPVDKLCKEHYQPLYERLAAGAPPPSSPTSAPVDTSTPPECLSNPQAALAGIIVYDQFPRNMFRKTPRAFATDPHALALSKYAVAKGFDTDLSAFEKLFMYMPLMHSEALDDQDAGIALCTACGEYDEKQMAFAQEHREIIVKYGRFPHRNALLGRESTPEEIAFMEGHEGYGQ